MPSRPQSQGAWWWFCLSYYHLSLPYPDVGSKLRMFCLWWCAVFKMSDKPPVFWISTPFMSSSLDVCTLLTALLKKMVEELVLLSTYVVLLLSNLSLVLWSCWNLESDLATLISASPSIFLMLILWICLFCFHWLYLHCVKSSFLALNILWQGDSLALYFFLDFVKLYDLVNLITSVVFRWWCMWIS